MTKLELLNELKQMIEHNIYCYSKDGKTKSEYKKEWIEQQEKLQLVNQLIAEQPNPLPEDFTVKVPDWQALVLVKDDCQAKTVEGKYGQQAYSAFISGYMTAQSELSKVFFNLFSSGDQLAGTIYNIFEPLRKQQEDTYGHMCDFLNYGEFDDLHRDGEFK